MIHRWKPVFDRQEIKYILSSGEDCVEKYEKEFARSMGSKYAFSFHYGRSAFYALIKSLDIKNKEILLPSFNCTAIPYSILASENVPRFCRISLTDYNCDINDMISRCTEKTKIVVPTFMYGYPVNVKELKERLNENIFIIEDTALALFTKEAGKFGDAAFYSFGLYKPLYTLTGGMVTTNNDELSEKLIKFRQENLEKCKKSYDLGEIFSFLAWYPIFNTKLYSIYSFWQIHKLKEFYSELYNSVDFFMSCLLLSCSKTEAKIGLSQIKKLRDIVNKRKKIAEFYNKELQHLRDKIVLPPILDGASFSKYTIRVNNRNEFIKNMLKRRVEVTAIFRYSLPHMPEFSKFADDPFDNCLKASESVINLPNCPHLLDNKEKLSYVIDTVEKCLE